MALIVETGAGLSNAESFISVADADAYHAARGNEATWSDLDDEVKEQRLRIATDYMQQVYVDRWVGTRKTYSQALEWPRAYALRSEVIAYEGADESVFWWQPNEVPTIVARACAELAFRSVNLPNGLLPDLDRAEKKVQVGPISIEYEESGRESLLYSAIDAMLSRLLIADDGVTGNAVMG